MKLASKLMLLNVLYFAAFSATAQDSTTSTDQYYQNQTSENTKKLLQYFQNFGQYLGFQVQKAPTEDNTDFTVSYKLINLTTSQLAQAYQFYTLLGSIPVNTFSGQGQQSGAGTTNTGNPFAQFLPTDSANTSQYNPSATVINPLANLAFPNYASTSSTGVSVTPLIDQQTFQQDPVSQAVLNILATPDYTYCMDPTNSTPTFVSGCQLIYNTLVPLNVVGEIPSATTFFDPKYLQQFLNQLNSNALTGPLMYSTQDLGTNQQQQGDIAKNGLNAQNQEQLAANFIRYVSGSILPISLPQWNDYDYWYKQTLGGNQPSSKPSTKQMQAQQTLAKYLASLRTYAAQTSVGISNLYFIMSKRMPQTNPSSGQTGSSSGPTSQALTEFNMATWRLYNTTSSGSTSATAAAASGTGGTGEPGNTPWINSLNNAPPATVEKEIAILLAEINYQLYLDRQVHERLLMTNSLLLLQSVRTGAPNADALSPGAQPSQ
ncbi:type IVB secretion system protein IcmX [Legionella bozemanae]|uniref:type IVB secretion system protein IcmX n=1 Tax=Legionella bozemanae TaxID=447 RepID=UPI001041758C|nr:type IVB secretion system protein IcmX [Legionella bozemanae]